MSPDTRRRILDAAEVDALRRAARHRIKQSAGRELDGEQQRRQEAMRRALRALRAFREGCELHRLAPPEQGRERGWSGGARAPGRSEFDDYLRLLLGGASAGRTATSAAHRSRASRSSRSSTRSWSELRLLDDPIELDKKFMHDVRKRLADSIETAVALADGIVEVELVSDDARVLTCSESSRARRPPRRGALQLDLAHVGARTLEPVDEEAFPALGLARAAAVAGGTAPCVLNAADEIAVQAS